MPKQHTPGKGLSKMETGCGGKIPTGYFSVKKTLPSKRFESAGELARETANGGWGRSKNGEGGRLSHGTK